MKRTDDENLAWEEIYTEHIVQDKWIDFRKSSYRYPDGRVYEPFYSYSRRDYTVIVASDEAGRFLCVRQFRQGIREVTTEFPAGGIERSDGREYQLAGKPAPPDGPGTFGDDPSVREDALLAAKRELMEETGYTSDDWTHLLTIPSNATIADNYAHIFRAKNCRKVGGQHLDETEVLHVRLHTAKEIEAMIKAGEFQQAMHVMAWLLVKEEG